MRLSLEDEEVRVLRRRSWLGVGSWSSDESRAVEGGEIGFVDILLPGEVTGLLFSRDIPRVDSEGKVKLALAKGPLRRSMLDLGLSDCKDGKGTTDESEMMSWSRFRTVGNSELCLPLTGVTGSLWETLSVSSSLSSGIGSESSVGN